MEAGWMVGWLGGSHALHHLRGFRLTEIGNFTLDDGLQIGQQPSERKQK